MEEKEKNKDIEKTKNVEKSKKKETKPRKKKQIEPILEEETKSNEEPKEIIREVIVEKKVGFNYLEVILIMIIMLIIGGFLGRFITHFENLEKNKKNEENKEVVESVSSEFKEFIDTYNDIRENYYEEVDKEELLDAGIKGMLEYLGDDYSLYMDQEETESFNEQVEGKYTGIGVEITQVDETITISRVFDNTPASKAGLKIDDQILKVDDEDITGKTASEIASIIKGSTKKEVTLKIVRDKQELDFKISLEEVELESVTGEIIEKDGKKIAYMNISIFASNTYSQFLSELTKLEVEGFDSLVIDVRGNTGGYLTSVTSIASIFLEKGKVIYQLDTKGVVEKIKDTTTMSRSYPIAVLMDKGSASASEILASALKESYGATIVGTYSYGKGTVQRAYQLESGATVKYTIQKWLTPKGNWINKVGVEPDVSVELEDAYFENPSHETDNQLQKALEAVSK